MNFISGGYYIITPVARPDYMDMKLIPDTIVSVSKCICDFHPKAVLRGGSNEEKRKYAQQLKISQGT